MKNILKYTFIGLLFLASACTKEELPTFSEDRILHFDQASEYPYRFSFATTPGANSYSMKIPMTLIGIVADNDMEFALNVITTGENPSTLDTDLYKFESKVFSKGVYNDTLEVTLVNNSLLKTEKLLSIEIITNQNFTAGPAENARVDIFVSNILSQPSWWDEDFTTAFLGNYSNDKYTAFIKATGVSDFADASVDEMIAYTREFVYYLRRLDEAGTPAYEADGITKIIDTINYKNV